MTRPDVPEGLEDRYWNGHAADCLRRGGERRFAKQYACSCGFIEVLRAAEDRVLSASSSAYTEPKEGADDAP